MLKPEHILGRNYGGKVEIGMEPQPRAPEGVEAKQTN